MTLQISFYFFFLLHSQYIIITTLVVNLVFIVFWKVSLGWHFHEASLKSLIYDWLSIWFTMTLIIVRILMEIQIFQEEMVYLFDCFLIHFIWEELHFFRLLSGKFNNIVIILIIKNCALIWVLNNLFWFILVCERSIYFCGFLFQSIR